MKRQSFLKNFFLLLVLLCNFLDIKSFMDYLKASYPEWIELVPIGKSSQGRTIHVIKLSKRRDNGLEASKKKAILIDAGTQ